jgi:hypothetical protein
MPIRRLLEGSGLSASEINRLAIAYETALRKLHLVDRDDPVVEMVARKVIDLGAAAGDPIEIARRAVAYFGIKDSPET